MARFFKAQRFSFLIFTGVFLYLNYGFWKRWDLPIYDGLYYFQEARQWPFQHLFLDRDWSPLYIVFYSGFHRVLGDLGPFWVYALHRVLVLYLILVLFWAICIRWCGWRLAAIATTILACNGALLDNFHVIHAAGLLFVLAALYLVSGDGVGIPLLLGLTLCGAFVRPEFIGALPLVLLYFLLRRRREPEVSWRLDWKAALFLLAAISLWSISVSRDQGPSRAFTAFTQQAAWAAEGESSVAADSQYRLRAARDYGGATTLLEALWTNPAAFSRTVFSNIAELPSALLQAPAHRNSHPWLAPLALILLAAASLSLPGGRGWPGRPFWVLGIAFAAAAVVSSVIIRPAIPYLLPTIPVIYLGTILAATHWSAGRKDYGLKQPAAVVVIMALIVLVVGTSSTMRANGQPILQFSQQLAKLNQTAPMRVLAYSPESYCVHARLRGLRCSGIGPDILPGYPDLSQLLEKEAVTALVVDLPLRQAAAQFQRSDLADLEADPESYGFRLAGESEGGLQAELFGELPWDDRSRLYLKNEPARVESPN